MISCGQDGNEEHISDSLSYYVLMDAHVSSHKMVYCIGILSRATWFVYASCYLTAVCPMLSQNLLESESQRSPFFV
jgi:hypothetical protein